MYPSDKVINKYSCPHYNADSTLGRGCRGGSYLHYISLERQTLYRMKPKELYILSFEKFVAFSTAKNDLKHIPHNQQLGHI